MGIAQRMLAVAAALTLSFGAAAHESKPHKQAPAPQRAAAQPAAVGPQAPLPLDIGGPFSLIDHEGRAVSDRDFRGRYMLVFFGYANCPGICPTGLRAMTGAVDLLGESGDQVAPLLITVDPTHDTPDNLAPAVAKIHPRLIGLTGSLAALDAAAKAYKVRARRAGHSWQGIGIIDHGSFVYLMGPDGRFLTFFPPIMDADAMAKAIAGYLG